MSGFIPLYYYAKVFSRISYNYPRWLVEKEIEILCRGDYFYPIPN